MARKATKIEIYQLCDVEVSVVVDKIVTLAKEDGQKSKFNRAILYHKALFLIHLVITLCKASKNNEVQIPASRLHRILDNEYTYILRALHVLKIIHVDEYYLKDVTCRKISLLNWNIKTEVLPNLKVISYLDKWQCLIEKEKKEENIELDIIQVDGKIQIIKKGETPISTEELDFRTKYEESLSYLRLKFDKAEAIEYINTLFTDKKTHSYHYYVNCIEKFDKSNLKIYSVDNQNRIYQVLTSLPKKLKSLFNIKYQLDIANSHPLLFCKILIDRYKISEEIIRIIYNINRKEYKENLHNVYEIVCNKLNINDINVPIDVVRYLCVASKGDIWDNFIETFPQFTRDEVKVKAFKEIFYPDKNFTEHTEFGRSFIELYPNVYECIQELKKKTKLPNLMMSLESRLMRTILTICYNYGWKVVHIHDALIVLDVEANDEIAPKHVKVVINNVYRTYLLHPTIHCDTF